jgi:hypothetical protein
LDGDGQRQEAYLRRCGSAFVGGVLHRLTPVAEDVWLLEGNKGRKAVAKHQIYGAFTRGEAYDLLEVEERVLDILAGLMVPRVLGTDPDNQFIFFEYCGGRTLEQVVSEGGEAVLVPLARQVMRGLLAIEARLAAYDGELAGCVVPDADLSTLDTRWRAAHVEATRGLELVFGTDGAVVVPGLERLWAWLGQRPAGLGTTDFNGRNIVVNARGDASFIEFAKIGWDWTERRLLQYTTVLAGGRGWICPWNPPAATVYAACGGGNEAAAALEGHRILFHLNAAGRVDGQALGRVIVSLLGAVPADAATGAAWLATAIDELLSRSVSRSVVSP